MLIEKPISGKVLRAQVRRHVGLHQVDVELGVDEEVEADHLEEAATVRILGGSFDEVRLLQGEHAPEENNRSVQFRFTARTHHQSLRLQVACTGP